MRLLYHLRTHHLCRPGDAWLKIGMARGLRNILVLLLFLFLLAPLSDVLARRLLTMAGGTKDHISQFLLTFPHVSSQSSVHCDAFSKYLHLNHFYLYMCSVYFAAKDQG